jgi:hypothetical protein
VEQVLEVVAVVVAMMVEELLLKDYLPKYYP